MLFQVVMGSRMFSRSLEELPTSIRGPGDKLLERQFTI
jgi:hypothetical protein